MDADRQKWNQRFSEKPLTLPNPPGYLLDVKEALIPGSVLELACGDGAGALYLAAEGFEVTAVDISEVALQRLQQFAQQKTVSLKTRVLDLDEEGALELLGKFNNIAMFHYKPSDALWAQLSQLLLPGGKLVISTFNSQHHQKKGFPSRFCLAPEEFLNRQDDLLLEHYQSVERNGGYMDDYIFRLQR